MEEVLPTAIRPAIETLNAVRDGRLMDELSVKIHDTVSAVQVLRKPGKVVITLDIQPWKAKGERLINEPLIVNGTVVAKPPEPDTESTLLYPDEDGNLRSQPPERKQAGLAFSIQAGGKQP